MSLQEDLARRIVHYRDLSGLSQGDLAGEVGIDRTAMSKIESGSRRVTALELAAFASALKVRIEWLFRDAPEAVVAFRTSTTSQITSDIDETLERLSRETEFVRRVSATNWPELQILGIESQLDFEQLASRVRHVAGYGEHPIRSMAELAEKLGVMLFSIDLGRDAPDGASSPISSLGIALVNGQRDVGRRRLTAGHEIGHLICGDDYRVDWRLDQPAQDGRETFLDRFSRALLLPARPLHLEWLDSRNENFNERVQALRSASEWQVDMSTLSARLLQLDLVDSVAAGRIRKYRHGRADFDELGLANRTDLPPTALPPHYIRSVLKLYRSERVSAERALDLLFGTYEEAELPDLDPLTDNGGWSLL